MNELKVSNKDEIVMKLLHYFITEEDYRPIILRGANNEIWLENLENNLKIIRINTSYLHNTEQLKLDLRRTKSIMKDIKRKTLTFNMNMLNIIIDAGENVDLVDDKDIETIKVTKISDLKKNKLMKSLFPKFQKVSNNVNDPISMMALTEEINKKTINEEKKLSKIFETKKPIITYTLIAINLLIFILMLDNNIYNYFINNFANHYALVARGEIYRLVTSGFLHVDIFHIFFNMYALSMVGKDIEKYYGKIKFLIIYFLSMIIGNLFASVFTNSAGIGASGAIFGLFGSLLYFSYNYRATIDSLLRSPLMTIILFNLALGFIIPNISISAHLGGLIGGFLTSMAVGIQTKNNKQDKANAIIVLILLILFLSFMTFAK